MRIELTGRHVDITPDIRRLVATKLNKLERVLNDGGVSAQVVLTRERYRHRAEITLHARGEQFLHAFAASSSWELAVSTSADRVGQQIQKMKGRWQGRKRDHAAKGAVEAERQAPKAVAVRPVKGSPARAGRPRLPRPLRASRQVMRTMSIADAARQVDKNGEGVLLFVDAETTAVSVIYRRADGELTLVQTET